MTCIVGVVQDGRAWLGADSVSADTSQWHCTRVRDPKVFHVGPLVLGFTNSWRMGHYHVAEMATPYAAVGCGEDYALEAFHATADLKWEPRQRLRRALCAAATFSAYVRAPFRILAEP